MPKIQVRIEQDSSDCEDQIDKHESVLCSSMIFTAKQEEHFIYKNNK